jgi:hypothetical protein
MQIILLSDFARMRKNGIPQGVLKESKESPEYKESTRSLQGLPSNMWGAYTCRNREIHLTNKTGEKGINHSTFIKGFVQQMLPLIGSKMSEALGSSL